MTLEQFFFSYGPLGAGILLAIYVVNELYKSLQVRDAKIAELNDKRLEDFKVLVTTLQENTAANKALSATIEGQNALLKELLLNDSLGKDSERVKRGRS